MLHLFSPNLTMNLTYLCYGPPKIDLRHPRPKSFRLKSISMDKVLLRDYCLMKSKEKEYIFSRIQTIKVRNI